MVIKWRVKKGLVTSVVHTGQLKVILKMNMLLLSYLVLSLWTMYMSIMYAKGVVKPAIKTRLPGFLSLLKCVLQLWHLLCASLQTHAVTDDQNSALQTLRVTVWSCKHIWAKVQKLKTWHIRCQNLLFAHRTGIPFGSPKKKGPGMHHSMHHNTGNLSSIRINCSYYTSLCFLLEV